MADRHSRTDEPELIQDTDARALAEARNALRQFDVGMVLLDHWLNSKPQTRYLRPSDLLTLNRFALEGVNRFAGTFRNTEVKIIGSSHQPPVSSLVPELVEDFCDYINTHWQERSATDLAAYALWRINWIHPFADGNGRTARIISYVILCAKLGLRLPGATTIPEQIAADKQPYYKALEAADREFDRGRIDVADVRSLIEQYLENQLEAALAHPDDMELKSMSVVTNAELLEARVQFLEDALRTSRRSGRHVMEFVERNPVLFTGIFGIISAILGALAVVLFGK